MEEKTTIDQSVPEKLDIPNFHTQESKNIPRSWDDIEDNPRIADIGDGDDD